MARRVSYANPPIIERALVIHTLIDEEFFRRAAENWQSIVQKEFPHCHTITEWTLAVTEKDGMPVLDPAQQTMQVRQTFWHLAGKTKEKGIQLWPDKIAFNLLGLPGQPRRFEELQQMVGEWVPRWASHFNIQTFSGVTLEYVNLLSETTLPSFVKEKTLKLGEAMVLFAQPLPLRNMLLTPPFDFQINAIGDTKIASRICAHCFTVPGPSKVIPSMQLRFRATSHLAERPVSPLTGMSGEIESLHELIIRHFEAYFTDRAKLSFQPL